MNVAQLKFCAVVAIALCLPTTVLAQSQKQSAHASSLQSAAATLAALPEADTIIYASPQKILNDAAPKVMSQADVAKMRAGFADIKKDLGFDPATIDLLAIAVRFQKPTTDLSFVPPDVLLVMSGDLSADSLITLAGVYLQDRSRTETYGSKTLTLMKIDPIAEAAQKNPLLKSFVEIGVVALNSNTLAVGTTDYLKAAVDAADGKARISSATINSLLRDPNALVSAAGSPLTAFAKSFGLLGTQTTAREEKCDSRFGDFYGAITMDASNFNLRGAMNTDNPDTAKIINGLLSSLLQPAIDSIPDKQAQTVLKAIRMLPRENEIVWEADVPHQTVATLIQEQIAPKKTDTASVSGTSAPAKTKPKTRRRVRRSK